MAIMIIISDSFISLLFAVDISSDQQVANTAHINHQIPVS